MTESPPDPRPDATGANSSLHIPAATAAIHAIEAQQRGRVLGDFRVARAAAAAAVTLDVGVDAFLAAAGVAADIAEVGVTAGVPAGVPAADRARLQDALAAYADLWRRWQSLEQRWQVAFWDPAAANAFTDTDRAALDRDRRDAAQQCLVARRLFGFLAKAPYLPPVRFHTPSPAEVAQQHADVLADPAPIFAAPTAFPAIERSRARSGPAGPEYLLRFPSPSRYPRDTVYAHVYEPADASPPLPIFIYGCGLAERYDQERVWPAEEFIGRRLADRGYRAVLIESPWHGRRTPPGFFSGEPYLAGAPATLFQLYSAQCQEIAVLIHWARSLDAPIVGVGGGSLGAIVAQQVAGRCRAWPPALRPDILFLAATAHHIDEVYRDGGMSIDLGLRDAIQAGGWNADTLRSLRPLLDPPSPPAVDPDRIVAVLGRRDTYMPYALGRQLLHEWRVPPANLLTWDVGHFGVFVNLLRRHDAQDLLIQKMETLRPR